MKFFTLLFLAGLALAATVPLPVKNVVSNVEFEDFLDELVYDASDDEPKTELGKKLREKFDELLEKVKDELENGKGVKEETIEKLREYREQLKDLKIGVGKHADELLDNLKDKVKDFWKKIWDKLSSDGDVYFTHDEPETELGKKIREKFDELLEKVKDELENGKGVKEETIEKLREYREQLKDLKIGVGKHADELLDNLKDKVKDFWKKIWDKLSSDGHVFFADDEPETELGKKLREKFDELLEKVKDALETGKGVNEETIEKLREYREQLKDLKIGVGKHADELLDNLKNKVKDFLKNIWDKLSSDDVFFSLS